MVVQVLDSPLRCPYDGKRMVLEIGQDGALGEFEMQAVHTCWHCGHSETEHEWTRPIGSTVTLSLAAIRDRVRAGVEVPMAYDRTPVTVEEALNAPLDA